MDLRDELLGCDDLITKEVDVPIWNRKVTIREQGLQEGMVAFSSAKADEEGKVNLNAEDIAQVVAFGVIDPATCERVFSDEDVPALAKKNREVLMFLYREIVALSGSVEESEKN